MTGEFTSAMAKLEKTLKKNSTSDQKIKAMNELRRTADTLETEVDDELWPLPKYSEMLFAY